MTPEDDTLCPSCHKNPAEPPHSCPYAEEMHEGADPLDAELR
jgi:hypothetical protein